MAKHSRARKHRHSRRTRKVRRTHRRRVRGGHRYSDCQQIRAQFDKVMNWDYSEPGTLADATMEMRLLYQNALALGDCPQDLVDKIKTQRDIFWTEYHRPFPTARQTPPW